MRLSTTGVAACGNGTVSIDGAVPAALVGIGAGSLFGPAWLNATTIVYQNNGPSGMGPSIFQSYNTSTHALTTLDPAGLNQCAAGNGKWATWLAGRGVKTSIGTLGTIADVTFGDIATDFGELALWTSPQTGTGVKVYNATGTTVLFEDATVSIVGTVMRVRGHLFAYLASTGWQLVPIGSASDAFAPRVHESIGWITPVVTAVGDAYVLEASTRLTLRAAGKPDGWEIAPVGTFTNYPDVMEVSPGVVRIGWCHNTGETPDSLHLVDLTLATGATRTATVVSGALIWTTGPTLARQRFEVGPVQTRGGAAGATGGLTYPPLGHPVVDASTGDRVTTPWAMYFQTLGTGIGANTRALAAQPAPSAPPPSFGVVAGPPVPLVATRPSDTFSITSADASIVITGDPVGKILDLSIIGGSDAHYDAPLSDGDLVAADLIYAAGECIIVQVPL